MEENQRGSFLKLPHTRFGWWAVGMTCLFVVLFISITTGFFHVPGFLTMGIGVVAGILTLLAIIWKGERSWLLWLMLLPGVFAILFTLGEILYPH